MMMAASANEIHIAEIYAKRGAELSVVMRIRVSYLFTYQPSRGCVGRLLQITQLYTVWLINIQPFSRSGFPCIVSIATFMISHWKRVDRQNRDSCISNNRHGYGKCAFGEWLSHQESFERTPRQHSIVDWLHRYKERSRA